MAGLWKLGVWAESVHRARNSVARGARVETLSALNVGDMVLVAEADPAEVGNALDGSACCRGGAEPFLYLLPDR